MPCSSTRCPGRPPYILFPPHGWSAPDGLPLLLRKQPIWAAGDTPHLMPVEQELPWHPVATRLAGQAIPFIVAASYVHAPPSPPFWFPVSRCSGCLSSLLVWLPRLLALLGAPVSHPLLSHPPAPAPPVRGSHISVRRGLSRARLAGHGPVATPVASISRRAGRSPPRWC